MTPTTDELARELEAWAETLERNTTLPVDTLRAAAARLREMSRVGDAMAVQIDRVSIGVAMGSLMGRDQLAHATMVASREASAWRTLQVAQLTEPRHEP